MCRIITKVSCFALLFALGVLVARETVSGDLFVQGTCPDTSSECNRLPNALNGSCPLTKTGGMTFCSWIGGGGTYVACGASTANCAIIQPYVPQDCNGACIMDGNIGCKVTFNKCH